MQLFNLLIMLNLFNNANTAIKLPTYDRKVFRKPNEQNEARFNSAMARKSSTIVKVFLK